jgi:hypothetical protein
VAALDLTTQEGSVTNGFRNVYRIRAGGRGAACLCELVSCENTGTVPLTPDSFYFLAEASFALACETPPEAPNLWRPDRKAAWIDPADGRWLGALTRAPRIRTMKFWLNQKRTFPHADAAIRPPVDITLKPGEKYDATGGFVYALIVAGTGGTAGWHAATTALEHAGP